MSRICFVSSSQGSFTCIEKEIFPFASDFVKMLMFYLTRLVGLEMWHAESFSFWVTSLGLVLTCFELGPLPPKKSISVGFWLFFFFAIVLASGLVFPFLHTHATITCFCNLQLFDTYLHCKCPVIFLHTHATIACFCILQLSDTSLHCKCPVCYY